MTCGILDRNLEQKGNSSGGTGKIQIKTVVELIESHQFNCLISIIILQLYINITRSWVKGIQEFSLPFLTVSLSLK